MLLRKAFPIEQSRFPFTDRISDFIKLAHVLGL